MLRVIDGESSPRTAVEVLDEITQLLDERLPDVAPDDPALPHLERFRRAIGPMPALLRIVDCVDGAVMAGAEPEKTGAD